MESLQTYYDSTGQFLSWLKQSNQEDRDFVIEKINQFLTKRAEMLLKLKPPFTKKEEELFGSKIIQQNKELTALLLLIKSNIQKDINGLKKNKVSVQRYINPYFNIQTDGFFYDKRK